MTFSRPSTFAASSATALTFDPATKPVTPPPSFMAALTAASDDIFSFPSLCSRTARVESRRARAASRDRGAVTLGRMHDERACRRAVCRAAENIVCVWYVWQSKWNSETRESPRLMHTKMVFAKPRSAKKLPQQREVTTEGRRTASTNSRRAPFYVIECRHWTRWMILQENLCCLVLLNLPSSFFYACL